MSWWDLLGKTKIDKSDITVIVDHKIFWLQIAIGDALLMQVNECSGHARGVEMRCLVVKACRGAQEHKELAAQANVEQQL